MWLYDQVTVLAIAKVHGHEMSLLDLVSVAMQSEAVGYVAERTGTTSANMQPAIGAALLKDGKMAGAVVFNNYHVLHKGSRGARSRWRLTTRSVSADAAYDRFSSILSSNLG